MSDSRELARIQNTLDNPLDCSDAGRQRVAGVVGEAPSRYSKSPVLWNAAFAHCRIDAVYLPFDVGASKLADFAAALRRTDCVMGINVTVPHKVAIMRYLDELDPNAQLIGAVNTVVRQPDGRLTGHNTDGHGFIDSILETQPGELDPFLDSLDGATALLLGAGGSARAVAFHIAERLNNGRLFICNRTVEHAAALAADIQKAGYGTTAIGEPDLKAWAPAATLVVNTTTKGQGGLSGLERYSALAPTGGDVRRNIEASLELAAAIPAAARFYDLIYHPEETVFLRHARQTGHRAMNGKAMIVNQALIALCRHICRAEIDAKNLATPDAQRSILQIMYRAW